DAAAAPDRERDRERQDHDGEPAEPAPELVKRREQALRTILNIQNTRSRQHPGCVASDQVRIRNVVTSLGAAVLESGAELWTLRDATEHGVELSRLALPRWSQNETTGALGQGANAVEVVIERHVACAVHDPYPDAPARRDLFGRATVQDLRDALTR